MSADVHGLVGAYAVDAIDERERAAFEQHLAECAECQAEVASLREAATQLSLLSETAAPAAMRDRVLADIRTVRPLPPPEQRGADTAPTVPASAPGAPSDSDSDSTAVGSGSIGSTDSDSDSTNSDSDSADSTVVPFRPRRRAATWLAGAAAAAAIAVGTVAWSPWDDGAPRGQVTAEQVLQADDAQRFQKTIDGARATIVRSASLDKAVIIADNMPPAPAGRDFQVWFDIPGRGMVSAGVMPHDAKPTVTMMLEGDATLATGAGITMEPAGGSPAPTTEPIALFAFS